MSKRSSPGDAVLSRLESRGQGGLYRRQMPGGGEVYTGPTATRALRTLGARAFTMDRQIFVAEDFDASNPEDQALYAHERHHQLNSGGDGAARSFHDAEEKASRAIERMVLHRAEQGEDFATVLRQVEARAYRTEGDVAADVASAGGGPGAAPSRKNPAEAALASLLDGGKDEIQLIEEFAEEIVASLAASGGAAALNGRGVGFV
jgi:hypothetical protein